MTPSAERFLTEQTLPATPASSAEARRIALAAASGLDAEARARVELVTSELVANAVEHGTGTEIVLGIRALAPGVEVIVRNRAGRELPPRPWTMPGPDARRGRGLAVVAAASDHVEADLHGDEMVVRAVVAR